jgi:hypothetical protein
MSAGDWPTVDELRLIVNVDPDSHAFDVTLARQMADGIALVKQQVGIWDDVLDLPDDQLAGAALRAAYLLSLKESPAAIVTDTVFATYMHGHHRRFSIA